MNKILILICISFLSACSSIKVSEYRSIFIKEPSPRKKLTVLPEKVQGQDCLPSVKKYAINKAILNSLSNKYPDAYGLGNVTITQNVEVFLINLHRCFTVVGQPIVDKK